MDNQKNINNQRKVKPPVPVSSLKLMDVLTCSLPNRCIVKFILLTVIISAIFGATALSLFLTKYYGLWKLPEQVTAKPTTTSTTRQPSNETRPPTMTFRPQGPIVPTTEPPGADIKTNENLACTKTKANPFWEYEDNTSFADKAYAAFYPSYDLYAEEKKRTITFSFTDKNAFIQINSAELHGAKAECQEIVKTALKNHCAGYRKCVLPSNMMATRLNGPNMVSIVLTKIPTCKVDRVLEVEFSCALIQNIQRDSPPDKKISARVFDAYGGTIGCGDDLFMKILAARWESFTNPSCYQSVTFGVKNHCLAYYKGGHNCTFPDNKRIANLIGFNQSICDDNYMQLKVDYRCALNRPVSVMRLQKSGLIYCNPDVGPRQAFNITSARFQAAEKVNAVPGACESDLTEKITNICQGKDKCDIQFADFTFLWDNCNVEKEIIIEYNCVDNNTQYQGQVKKMDLTFDVQSKIDCQTEFIEFISVFWISFNPLRNSMCQLDVKSTINYECNTKQINNPTERDNPKFPLLKNFTNNGDDRRCVIKPATDWIGDSDRDFKNQMTREDCGGGQSHLRIIYKCRKLRPYGFYQLDANKDSKQFIDCGSQNLVKIAGATWYLEGRSKCYYDVMPKIESYVDELKTNCTRNSNCIDYANSRFQIPAEDRYMNKSQLAKATNDCVISSNNWKLYVFYGCLEQATISEPEGGKIDCANDFIYIYYARLESKQDQKCYQIVTERLNVQCLASSQTGKICTFKPNQLTANLQFSNMTVQMPCSNINSTMQMKLQYICYGSRRPYTVRIAEKDEEKIYCDGFKTIKVESATLQVSESFNLVITDPNLHYSQCSKNIKTQVSDICNKKSPCTIRKDQFMNITMEQCPNDFQSNKEVIIQYTCENPTK